MILPARLAACLLLTSVATTAVAEPLEHTFVLTLRHSSGATLAIPPSISALEVTAPSAAGDNPLYEGQTAEKTNPLYEPAAAPGSPGSVIGVAFDFTKVISRLSAVDIVHRDLAARNLRVTTEEGIYEADPATVGLFSNDGPADLRGVGPVRWMAPESIRTRTYSSTSPGGQTGYWEIAAFSYFDVAYPVPEPSGLAGIASAAGVTLGGATRSRRRRS